MNDIGCAMILVGVGVGYSLGVFTFWFAMKLLGRMKYDLENGLPVLDSRDRPAEFDYTGE
jgi:hypothetical protein